MSPLSLKRLLKLSMVATENNGKEASVYFLVHLLQTNLLE